MRKQKLWKRLAALALTGVMTMSLAACGDGDKAGDGGGSKSDGQTSSQGEAAGEENGGKDLSWLNTGGDLPIVNEGTEKTLSILTCMDVESPAPEETWMYEFIQNAMNIKLEVTKCLPDNRVEIMSLAFASDDLPDVIIGGQFSAGDLVKYGVEEGQLIDLAPYINADIMPNLTALYEYNPSWRLPVTDAEGHVWSLGYISDPAGNQMMARMFVNYDLLEAENLEVPTTLDELTNVLRTLKNNHPDMYPLGGSYKNYSPMMYLLNAFGYVTNNSTGLDVGLRNGKVVLPVADREAYGEFLTYMNMLYTEGLIHPDFFTMENTAADAVMSEGKNAFYGQAPFVFLDTFGEWWGALPLTSEYNDTAMWPINTGTINKGNFVVTKECEDPELALAFADWFYATAEGTATSHFAFGNVGVNAEEWPEYLYNTGGWYWNDAGEKSAYDVDNNPDLYNGFNDYVYKKIKLWQYAVFGCELTPDMSHNYEDDRPTADAILANYENPADARGEFESGQIHFEIAMRETLCKYRNDEVYPGTVYFDTETQLKVNDLLVVLTDYATTETAKFITGARPLEELDAYFDEIERLGATEYVQIYADYYESTK